MAHNQQWFSEPTIHACFREAVKATAGQHGDVAQTWIDSLEKRLVGTLAARLRLEGATETLPPKSDLRWQLKLDAAEARGREMRAATKARKYDDGI